MTKDAQKKKKKRKSKETLEHEKLELGLVEEVERLLGRPDKPGKQAREALGYKEVIEHLEGKLSADEMRDKIKQNTRRFAKRQMTWFRSFCRVNWLAVDEGEDAESVSRRAQKILEK